MGELYNDLEIPQDDVRTSILEEEAEWLLGFVRTLRPGQTIETGFAYGCSTAHIMVASGGTHVSIDPFQHEYDDLGLANIERLDMTDRLRFIKAYAHEALPMLLAEGFSTDLFFIDGGHKFDDVFLDWYYADLLLNPEGVIVLHDSWMAATQRVASFIRTNRSDYDEISIDTGYLLGFRKIGHDTRPWDHYVDF